MKVTVNLSKGSICYFVYWELLPEDKLPKGSGSSLLLHQQWLFSDNQQLLKLQGEAPTPQIDCQVYLGGVYGFAW